MKNEPLQLTETEKKIIAQYRKLTNLQPSIKKLLDIVETDNKPRISIISKHYPTATGGQQ